MLDPKDLGPNLKETIRSVRLYKARGPGWDYDRESDWMHKIKGRGRPRSIHSIV